MTDDGLLTPGAHRCGQRFTDRALVGAMVEVELAWLDARAETGAADRDEAAAIAQAVNHWSPDVAALAEQSEGSGNPVVPLVAALRDHVGDQPHARLIHQGLTSQDVVDTALMLLARDCLQRVSSDLSDVVTALAALADEHRRTLMAGRTITQHAVPISFGLKATQWLSGVLDARDEVRRVERGLSVQCGGAAGTRSLITDLHPDPDAWVAAFARKLDLGVPTLPWHTNRRAITRVGDALVSVCDALGVIGADVALLSRPEIGEVREGAAPGRGGSSTMPHKRNPVLSVLIRSAALQAPMLGAQLHLASGAAVDERPDGAWHSEWEALRRLLVMATTAGSQARELVADLEVDAQTMRRRAHAVRTDLVAESGDVDRDPATYLGQCEQFIDAALSRARQQED